VAAFQDHVNRYPHRLERPRPRRQPQHGFIVFVGQAARDHLDIDLVPTLQVPLTRTVNGKRTARQRRDVRKVVVHLV
jgi:hypothetical protein